MKSKIKVKTSNFSQVPGVGSKDSEKIKRDDKEARSREDWEGGGSRPTDENVPKEVQPNKSPAKNLQRQAESVPKTTYGDNGPPQNLQSLPTQNTNEISAEEEAENKTKKVKK